MAEILKKIFKPANERALSRLKPIVEEINKNFEKYSGLKVEEMREFQERIHKELTTGGGWEVAEKIIEEMNDLAKKRGAISDEELKAKTEEFRQRIKEKVGKATGEEAKKLEQEALNEILPEAYAVVKEACRRLLGKEWEVTGHKWKWDMVPFDVQLMGAIVLHQGKIAEMATGEGKTLVATMPLYLNSLVGKGAHLVTVNEYLARRDSQWMGGVYNFLGVSCGCIQDAPPNSEERRKEYECDITYGTNNEFGFDYLRDNMCFSQEEKVQRGHYYAIVDEVDSVLIDEARTPLIISGAVERTINREYNRLKPRVERAVRAQTVLVNKLISEAEKLLKEGKEKEAGKKLIQVEKGAPKNRRLMKLKKEGKIMKLMEDVEKELMAEEFAKKTGLKKEESELHKLQEELYFTLDEKSNVVNITEKGREIIAPGEKDFFTLPDLSQELPKIDKNPNLSPREKLVEKQAVEREYAEKSEKLHAINQLLRAYSLFQKDVEYVVQNNQVIIVDEFTGRLMPGRRYSDGLHQALEAKEGVKVESETQTLATITLQNYFRMYQKLAGMTGTAETEAREFWDIYKLEVIVIPTNKPVRRVEYDDVIYKTRKEKYDAIIKEIEEMHKKGRPVLVGTVSVDVSETLSRMLRRKGISHQVLNAKHHQREAEIVALAGQRGKVTIATNMAGRGTDIKLGEGVVKCEVCCISCTEDCSTCTKGKKMKECLKEPPCGLHVIGTERHEARRIDRQLRGRCARQGDPGSARFYLSLEDNLMRLFGSDRIAGVMARWGPPDGEPIQHKLVTRAIEGAQKRVERFNFDIRKRLLEYDDVINKQRETVYKMRDEVLERGDISERIRYMIEDVVETIVDNHTTGKYPETWDWEGLRMRMRETFLFDFEIDEEERLNVTQEELREKVKELIINYYKTREIQIGKERMKDLEYQVLLFVLDRRWREHLYELDALKEGIGLRGYGQRDPLVEFKREAYTMFEELLYTVNYEVVRNLFGLRFRTEEEMRRVSRVSLERAYKPEELTPKEKVRQEVSVGVEGGGSILERNRVREVSPDSYTVQTYRHKTKKVGRNDPCPCGSGKKYKKCCGRFS